MLFRSQENIWVGTWNKELYKYHVSSKTLHQVHLPNFDSYANTIYQDSSENIWVGTAGDGLYKIINPNDSAKTAIRHYKNRENDLNSLLDDVVYSLYEDKESGNLWIGSRKGLSLLNMDSDQDQFQNYFPDESKKHSLPFSEVSSITSSRDGVIWIGMYGGGVSKVIPTKPYFKTISLDKEKK